jgi:hypothetical protein
MIETSNQNGVKTKGKPLKFRLIKIFIMTIVCAPFGIFLYILIGDLFFPSPCPKNCITAFESEASMIKAALADYFAIPSHIKVPTIEDLIKLNSYIPPERRNSSRKIQFKGESCRESDLRVFILGDGFEDIEITVTSIKGQCFQGNAYRYYMGQNDIPGAWLQAYGTH